MSINVYRCIFRLDFPVLYTLLDHLGEHADAMVSIVRDSGIEMPEDSISIELLQRQIHARFKSDDFAFYTMATLTSYIFDLQVRKGYPIDQLAKHPIAVIADRLVSELFGTKTITFNRIGLKAYILDKMAEEDFKKLLPRFSNNNKHLIDAISKSFAAISDYGIVLEATNSEDIHLHTAMGPYQSSEYNKYFGAFEGSNIEKGMITNIDVWQSKIELPKISVKERMICYQDIIRKIHISTRDAIVEDVKEYK